MAKSGKKSPNSKPIADQPSPIPSNLGVTYSAPKLPVAFKSRPLVKRLIVSTFIVITAMLVVGLIINTQAMLSAKSSLSEHGVVGGKSYKQYHNLAQRVADFERLQSSKGIEVVPPSKLDQELSNIQLEIQVGQRKHARQEIASLNLVMDDNFVKLNTRVATAAAAAAAAAASRSASAAPAPAVSSTGRDVPILLYHYTPSNFDSQLTHLEQAGYTTVSLDQVAAALSGHGALPAKPVVITFDDGFANQTTAASLLNAHHMKATFYIINGGEASRYCIGAGRQPGNCGDAYLTWDQIRELDRNPLFSIESHTVDHLELAKQSPAVQRFQIFESKRGIEAELGHSIHHFCYPYGSFNQTTIQLVREAGFTTATTTVPGSYQSTGSLYTLKRVRNALDLR